MVNVATLAVQKGESFVTFILECLIQVVSSGMLPHPTSELSWEWADSDNICETCEAFK